MSWRQDGDRYGGHHPSSSGRSSGRPAPRDYRDLDRERERDRDRYAVPRRSVSPTRRYERSEDNGRSQRTYGDARSGGDYRERAPYGERRYEERRAYRPQREDYYQRDGPPPPRDERDRYEDRGRREYESPPPPPPSRRTEESSVRRRGDDRRGDQKGNEGESSGVGEIGSGQGEAEGQDVGDAEEDEMMKAMGFGGFGTTKGAKVHGNQAGLAEVKKERTWRQYMQRKGGFNRPLSPVRK